jgi:hypothetical protein
MPRSRDEILWDLASVAAALADLARTRDQVQARTAGLRKELAAISPTAADAVHMQRSGHQLPGAHPTKQFARSSGRSIAGDDDGFGERSPIFLLADSIHRP